jgi:hypothetical protein
MEEAAPSTSSLTESSHTNLFGWRKPVWVKVRLDLSRTVGD